MRLFGLWALLFCATSEGDAAPKGECRPSGSGAAAEGRWGFGREASKGSAGPRAAAEVGVGSCFLDAQRSATAASGARFEVGDPGAAGLSWILGGGGGGGGAAGGRLAAYFPCAEGKIQGTWSWGAGAKHAHRVGGGCWLGPGMWPMSPGGDEGLGASGSSD